MSKIMTNIKLVLFAAVLTTQGCNWSTEWTEEKRQEFKEKCDTQRVFNPNPICFLGFDLDDVDSILVFEKKGYVIIDTITVRLQKGYRSEIDRNNKKYWGASEKDFNIEYSYRFELSPTRLFLLHNMEMMMSPEYTMGGEGWGCNMRKYQINNDSFDQHGNITITR